MQTSDPVVFLHKGHSGTTPIERLMWASVLALGVATVAYFVRWEMLDGDRLLRGLANAGAIVWLQVCAYVGVVGYSVIARRRLRSSSLVVDDSGIRLEPKEAAGSFLFPARKMVWTALVQASYLRAVDTVQLRSKSGFPLNFRARDWLLQPGRAPVAEPGKEPDLVRVLRARGVFERPNTGAAALEFDLFSNPATRTVLVGLAILIAYALVDTVAQVEAWAFFDSRYLLPHATLGLLAGAAVYWWFTSFAAARDVPKPVMGGLTIMVLFVVAVASYVGGIRINQFAGEPLAAIEYHRDASCDNLVPVDSQFPAIEYTSLSRDYWCSIPVTRPVPVQVRKGLFGLYQVNLSEHTDAIRRYREGQR